MIFPLSMDVTVRPFSTIIVVSMALGVNVLFAVGRRIFTNVERAKRWRVEAKEFRAEQRQAILSKDKKKEEKLKKKEKTIREMEMKMSMESLKVSMLFFVPLLLLWWLVSGILGANTIVALSPIAIPLLVVTIQPELNFWWFYLISSFAFSSIITKLFGVGLD